ncbi:MAG: hypothetical protein HQL64_11810 [Magnetococcales bacterium]|nr:hypothetical protein [Magnetococcales bacterium]
MGRSLTDQERRVADQCGGRQGLIKRRDVSQHGVLRAGEAFLHRKCSSAAMDSGLIGQSDDHGPRVQDTKIRDARVPDADNPVARGQGTKGRSTPGRVCSNTGSGGDAAREFELPPIQTVQDMEIGLGRILTAIERQEISREEGRRLYALVGSFHKRRLAI